MQEFQFDEKIKIENHVKKEMKKKSFEKLLNQKIVFFLILTVNSCIWCQIKTRHIMKIRKSCCHRIQLISQPKIRKSHGKKWSSKYSSNEFE